MAGGGGPQLGLGQPAWQALSCGGGEEQEISGQEQLWPSPRRLKKKAEAEKGSNRRRKRRSRPHAVIPRVAWTATREGGEGEVAADDRGWTVFGQGTGTGTGLTAVQLPVRVTEMERGASRGETLPEANQASGRLPFSSLSSSFSSQHFPSSARPRLREEERQKERCFGVIAQSEFMM